MGVYRLGFGVKSSKETAAAVVETCRETGSRAALPHAGQPMPGAAINGSERASFRSTAPSPMGKAGGGSGPTDPKDDPQNAVCRRLSLWRNVPGRGLKTAGHRLAAWAGMFIVAFVALSAASAQAQSPVTLVSNMEQTAANHASSMMAQGFTTGSATSGYTLTSVGVPLGSRAFTGNGILVRIFTVDSDGEPDSLVYALSNPATVTANAVNMFTAPADATLDAGTTYSVVVTNASSDGQAQYPLGRTNSNGQDAGAATGWSIANTRYWSTTTFGSWSSSSTVMRISVHGHVSMTTTTSTDAKLSDLELQDTSDDSTITISPTFASNVTTYTASVANDVDEILVDPTTNDGNATVQFFDATDMAIGDADGTEDGHQAALAVGDNTIKVKVTAEDGNTTQTYTVTVTRAEAPDATGQPTISGTPQVNETLTAAKGDIADGDGLPSGTFPAGYTFQWIRVASDSTETAIANTNSSTYTPVAADVGTTIKVAVSFTDAGGAYETLTSDAYPARGYPSPGIAAQKPACPTGNEWCEEMTVGFDDYSGTNDRYGYQHRNSGFLTRRITYDGTTSHVTDLYIRDKSSDPDDVLFWLTAALPVNTVLKLDSTAFPITTSNIAHNWPVPMNFGWAEGQKVTVSLNFPRGSRTAP